MNLGEEDKVTSRIPILSEDKLVEFLNRFLYLNVSKEDLNNPEIVIVIYETFLKDFGFNIDALNQLNWSAAETFEGNIENYEETIPMLNLLTVMNIATRRAGINDFTIRDIMEPKRKRTRRILSYFANYWQFSAKNLEMWLKAKETYSEIGERKKESMDDIERIKEFVKERRIQLQHKNIQQVKEECEVNVEEFNKTIKRKEEVTEKYQILKQKYAERKSYLSNLNVQMASCIERKKELESKIISSEQRQELEAMADKLHLYAKTNEEIFSKIEEHKKLKNMHSKTLDTLNKGLDVIINNANKEINKDRMIVGNIEDIYNVNKMEQQKSRDLRRQIQQKNSELSHLEEWNQREEMKHKKQIEELKLLISEQESYMESNPGEAVVQQLQLEKERLVDFIGKYKMERKKIDQEINRITLSMAETFKQFGRNITKGLEVIDDELEALQKRKINFDE